MTDDIDLADAFGFLKGDLDGFDEAMAIVRSEDEAIQYDVNAELTGFRERGLVVEV